MRFLAFDLTENIRKPNISSKGILAYFQPETLSEILTIANLRHATSKKSTYTESEFRLCRMKIYSSENH